MSIDFEQNVYTKLTGKNRQFLHSRYGNNEKAASECGMIVA